MYYTIYIHHSDVHKERDLNTKIFLLKSRHKSNRAYVHMCVCKIQLPDPRLTFAALFACK